MSNYRNISAKRLIAIGSYLSNRDKSYSDLKDKLAMFGGQDIFELENLVYLKYKMSNKKLGARVCEKRDHSHDRSYASYL